jgi:alkylation response protein AidB-like acyl-CoA dehydrogenase
MTPVSVFGRLRESYPDDESPFVIQNELDRLIDRKGGGACASAVAIDALQGLRLMNDQKMLDNPHKAVLKAFNRFPVLLKGRVTNESLVQLMSFYDQYLECARTDIVVESAPKSSFTIDTPMWSRLMGPNLTAQAGRVSILSYTVTLQDGRVLGRHFVILLSRTEDLITVLDPSSPQKDRRYALVYDRNKRGECEHIFLNQPADAPARTSTFELNTVFTVALHREHRSSPQQSTNTFTVEEVKKRIDETAAELRGPDGARSPLFLSPVEWRRRTAKFGLTALDLPTDVGGLNWSAERMIDIFKHAGRHNLNFRDVVGGAHARPLLRSSNPQVRQVVRQIASGEGYMAIAMTEPTAGSDFHSIKSQATKVDGGYLLTGEKQYVARLEQATHVVLFTRAASGKQRALSAFLVPMSDPSLSIVRMQAHGLTGNSFGGIKFDKLFVPDSFLLGSDGDGEALFSEHFRYWRLMQVAAALGTAEQALEQMANRLKTREAFGGPIGRFSHLQQALGQHTTELRMAYCLAKEAAVLYDKRQFDEMDLLVNGLKAEAVEIALNAVDAAVRSFGGEGYSDRVDLGDRLRDLNGLRIADGTTDVMRMAVVAKKFGPEFWNMAVRGNSKPISNRDENSRE